MKKSMVFVLAAIFMFSLSCIFKSIDNIPYFLVFSKPIESFSFADIIIFQISSSFLTIAFMSMIGDKSEKAVYGTNLSEYILVRPYFVNWSNMVTLIVIFSIVNFFNFMFHLYTFIIWYLILGLSILIYLIRNISLLFFNKTKTQDAILSEYKSYMKCSLSKRRDAFVSGDMKRLYLYTKEKLYNNSFNAVKENFEVYSDLICYSIDLDISKYNSLLYHNKQIKIKEAVMHFALLIEECKTDGIMRNDLCIDAILYFLRSYFSNKKCDEESIHKLHEALGGYKNQILQNNFEIPFNQAFDFTLVHFLCEGHSDPELNHGSIEAVKYISSTKHSSLSIRDYQDWTPFLEACEYNQYEIIEFMISQEMTNEINHKDKNNITPLEIAFVNGNMDIVKLLLKNNAYISLVDKSYQEDLEKIKGY